MIETTANNRVKQNISLYIFLFVNFIFLIKYLSRTTDYSFPVSIAITAFYYLIWHYRRLLAKLNINFDIVNYALLGGFISLSAFLLTKIDVHTLNVDRWSIITAYWKNYFYGEYVYYAESFVGSHPGPMPFYFVTALPFMLIGELGYYSLMGVIVMYAIVKWEKIAPASITVLLLLVMLSCFYLWEVFSRSNILVNAALVLAVVIYFLKQINFESLKTKLTIGVLIGLVMSTRNVFVIPFIILFLYALKVRFLSWVQALIIGGIALVVFTLTFVPFVIGFVDDFLLVNPFMIQSSVLIPFTWSLTCIIISAIFFLFCKNKLDVIFYSGIALFLTVIAHLIYQGMKHGYYEALFDSYADISYFMLGVPFTLYYLFKTDASSGIS